MSKWLVYDCAGDHYPPVEADYVKSTEDGFRFFGPGDTLVAFFAAGMVSGLHPFAEQQQRPLGKWWQGVKLLYTCPECGMCCPIEDSERHILCNHCGRELGDV